MNKYNISKEYKKYFEFYPPLNRTIFPLASKVCELLTKWERIDKDLKVTNIEIETVDKEKIKLYIYEQQQEKTDKVILYLHGGGFVFEGYTSHFKTCKRYVKESDCKLVYVEYRLAPKYAYPMPLEDCFSAYQWLVNNRKLLGIDTDKIIIAGDSAGGLLAVDLICKINESALPKPCYQLLIYPVLDSKMRTESMKQYHDTPMWNSKLNKKAWNYYLQGKKYTSILDRNNNLIASFPKTYIETAEYDCLHDEGILLANILEKENIPVILNETKNTMHGFDVVACKTTEVAIQKRIEILKSIE